MKIIYAILLYLLASSMAFAQILASRSPMTSKPLIETFTSMNCKYCPSGDVIQNQISNSICLPSIVNFHSGTLAIPINANQPDYRTSNGDTIDSVFNRKKLYPTAMFNRTINTDSSLYFYTEWINQTNKILVKNSPVNIGIKSTYDKNTNKILIDLELYYTADVPFLSNYLNIYILENKVKGFQIMSNGATNYNYEHNHVFRTSLTDLWGHEIRGIGKNKSIKRHYEYQIDSTIKNISNLEITAFVAESKVNIYTSTTINASDGYEGIAAEVRNWDEEHLILNKNDYQTIHLYFTSRVNHLQILDFNIQSNLTPNITTAIKVNGVSTPNASKFYLFENDSLDIAISFQSDDLPAYGKFTIHLTSELTQNNCEVSTMYKELFCKLKCGNVVILKNDNNRFDGLPNNTPLDNPIKNALSKLSCKNVCDLKYAEMLSFNTYLDTTCKSYIFYALGWGKPAMSDSMVNVLTQLIQSDKIDLFLEGQDVAFQMAGPTNLGSASTPISRNFLNQYMQADYIDNGDSTRNKLIHVPSDTFFKIIKPATIEPVYKTATSLNLNPDRAFPTSNIPMNFLAYNDNQNAGFYSQLGGFKFVYLGVGLEMFPNDLLFTQQIVQGVLKYFNQKCETTITKIEEPKHTATNVNVELISIENKILIDFIQPSDQKSELRLFNISGKNILEKKYPTGLSHDEINIQNLTSGLYLIEIRQDGKIPFVKKIFIN